MRRLGSHVSASAEGFDRIPINVFMLGQNAAQIFLGNPKTFNTFKLTSLQSLTFRREKAAREMSIYAHAPYVLHAFAKPVNRVKNNKALARHFYLAASLGLDGYVVHMGGTSHYMYPSQYTEDSLHAYVVLEELCSIIGREVLDSCPLLLENCASGNFLSGNLGAIADVVSHVRAKGYNVGMCLDTLHLYSWGMELESLGPQLSTALSHIRLVHLNSGPKDFTFGCRRDRHLELLAGCIPIQSFVSLLYMHPECSVILERDSIHSISRDMEFVRWVDSQRELGLDMPSTAAASLVYKAANQVQNQPVLDEYERNPEVV